MNFVSLHFIVSAVAKVLVYQASGSVKAKQWVLMIAFAYFISTYMLEVKSAVPLVLFLGLGSALVAGVGRRQAALT